MRNSEGRTSSIRLDSAVLAWHSSYYRPGRLAFGFDVWVRSRSFDSDCKNCSVTLRHFGSAGRTFVMLAVMNEHGSYKIRCDGEDVGAKELTPGTLQIELPAKAQETTVEIISK